MTISNRNAAILLDENLHTVTCIYEEHGKEYKFLALKKWGVKAGDQLLVQESNGGNHLYLKVVQCIDVDLDADVEIDRDRKYRFISGIFNDLLTEGEARLTSLEVIIKKSRKKQARTALRATLADELRLDCLEDKAVK